MPRSVVSTLPFLPLVAVCLFLSTPPAAGDTTIRSTPGWEPVELPVSGFAADYLRHAPASTIQPVFFQDNPGGGGGAAAAGGFSLAGGGEKSTRSKPVKGHFLSSSDFAFWNAWVEGSTTIAVPGRLKVAENNSAQPKNRVYLFYNRFHNAGSANIVDGFGAPVFAAQSAADRYTIGFERATPAFRHSLEVRLPLQAMQPTTYVGGFSSEATNLGNLTLISKHVVLETDNQLFSIGTGITLPTGDDATFLVGTDEIFAVRNEAVHIVPYVAWLSLPRDGWFVHWFAEVDIPAGGNAVEVRNFFNADPFTSLGRLNDQVLLCIDLSIGRYFYRNRESQGITALAGQIEFHYSTTLNDADLVAGSTPDTGFRFGYGGNRFDAFTLTVGSDLELRRNTDLRFAAMFPIRMTTDRFFDAEIMAGVVRRF